MRDRLAMHACAAAIIFAGIVVGALFPPETLFPVVAAMLGPNL